MRATCHVCLSMCFTLNFVRVCCDTVICPDVLAENVSSVNLSIWVGEGSDALVLVFLNVVWCPKAVALPTCARNVLGKILAGATGNSDWGLPVFRIRFKRITGCRVVEQFFTTIPEMFMFVIGKTELRTLAYIRVPSVSFDYRAGYGDSVLLATTYLVILWDSFFVHIRRGNWPRERHVFTTFSKFT